MSNYAEIAIPGPLKKTFSYRIPDDFEELSPGQRILVPFGTSRKIGFYLGIAKPPQNFTIKPVSKVIDKHSLFKPELFKLCLWMSEYYFANPADCLVAALPTIFKKNKQASYTWATLTPELIPEKIQSIYIAGKNIKKTDIQKMNDIDKKLLSTLIGQQVIIEYWADEADIKRQTLSGYKIKDLSIWQDFYKNKKNSPEPYDGLKDKKEMLDIGWTNYQITQAIKNSLIIPVYSENNGPLLDFIKPKKDLSELKLNDEQKTVVQKVISSASGFKPFLIHGVTGSGKTIVYCHICQSILKQGKSALVLTPEIALTSTTLAYFRGFFGDKVTVIHSAMTEKERLESWQGIRNGKYKIVVGPRSAIFAPLPDPGVIIVDEEHDSSYKQDEPTPRFHGRDCAIMRAKINNIPVVLGSASPSLESYYNATQNRYELLQLTKRPGSFPPHSQISGYEERTIIGRFDLYFISSQKRSRKTSAKR